MHILIIKEDDANLKWINDRLIESGFIANLICVLPADAVALVHAIKFNLIIYDLSLPGKASAEDVQKLIAEAKNVPVVVLANSLESGVAVEAIKGAYDYIIKDKLKSGIAAECFSVLLSKYKLHYN
jgi:DNA-binding response OmpR family regulator